MSVCSQRDTVPCWAPVSFISVVVVMISCWASLSICCRLSGQGSLSARLRLGGGFLLSLGSTSHRHIFCLWHSSQWGQRTRPYFRVMVWQSILMCSFSQYG